MVGTFVCVGLLEYSLIRASVRVRADTVCIHGDKPTAVPFVKGLRAALEAASVAVAPA